MSPLSWSKIWTICHNIFGPICDVLPAVWRHVDVLSQDFSQHVCDVQPAFQQSVDVLLHYFWTFVMSCHLLSKLWMFCHRIFSTRLPCPAGFSAKCGHLSHLFLHICDVLWPAQQTADVLSQDLWKNTDEAVSRKKQEISWDSPFKWPLRISCHKWKWAEMGEF